MSTVTRMSKKRSQNQLPKPIVDANKESIPAPTPRRYVPPTCSACVDIRPSGEDFTEVYSSKIENGIIYRYCRCKFCGNTFRNEIAVKPRTTTFVPSPCTACESDREPGSNYSRVVSTQGRIRYCKCTFCENTWKQTE